MGAEKSEKLIPARVEIVLSDRTSLCIAGAMWLSANITLTRASSSGSISVIFILRLLNKVSQVAHDLLVTFQVKASADPT